MCLQVAGLLFLLAHWLTGCPACLQMYQVPYTSLTMHVSRDGKQRDQATALRMVIETVALMMGSVVQGAWRDW